MYQNIETGETISVDTQQDWGCLVTRQQINGTSIYIFERHLAELVCINIHEFNNCSTL